MQKFFCLGNLTKKPESRTAGNTTITTFTVAVNEGEKVEYFTITAWGVLAQNCAKYLDKGSKVFCECWLHQTSYTGKDGDKKYSWEFNAIKVEFISTVKKEEVKIEEVKDEDNLPF